MDKTINLALIGASGVVGQKILQLASTNVENVTSNTRDILLCCFLLS